MNDFTLAFLTLGGWASIGFINYIGRLFYLGLTDQNKLARETKEVWTIFLLLGPLLTLFGLGFIVLLLVSKVPVRFNVSLVAWSAGYRVREWLRK